MPSVILLLSSLPSLSSRASCNVYSLNLIDVVMAEECYIKAVRLCHFLQLFSVPCHKQHIWCSKMFENDKTHLFCTKKPLSESHAQGEACKAFSLNY